jgi:simple sugar transport system ATP-binding protein
MPAMLEMRGIAKSYGEVRANRGIDLTVPAGWILGLLGENGSGKSTLMKCLFGMVAPDAGGIVFKGRELVARSPRDAIAAGIGMIHQHFTLVDAMTVAENMMLGWERTGRWIDSGAIAELVRNASRDYGLDLDPNARVGDLPLGARQRVEIVKAIVRGCDLLILDEPTSILGPPEIAVLLGIMRRLRSEGRSVIFISHKLGEVLEVCDEIVVLRDGEVAGRCRAGDATRDGLARMMVGRELAEPRPRTPGVPGASRLVVEALAAADFAGVQRLKGATFSLRAGEVLAIAGVDGNGQAELANVLAGLVRPTAGRIEFEGEDIVRVDARERLARGIAYIPADRSTTSLVQDMSVTDNLCLRDFDRAPLARRGRLDARAIAARATERIRRFDIRCPGAEVEVRALSGGNRQKVVVAREIGRAPKVLIAFQPTWGLDPGATRFVMDQVLELRERGGAVLYISSELEEVLAVGDRIGVLFDGRIVDSMAREEADADRIGLAMSGGDRRACAPQPDLKAA